MQCHNGSLTSNYSGPGMENPHPFPGADEIECSVCHGGDKNSKTQELAHIPPPPEIGDREFQDNNRFAYFNRLTLTGIDQLPDYTVNGRNYTALDYLQFINPGDLRVVTKERGCGACHDEHSETVNSSILATSAGISAVRRTQSARTTRSQQAMVSTKTRPQTRRFVRSRMRTMRSAQWAPCST